MLVAIIKEMRLRQWTKNIFLMAALVFDQKLFYWVPLYRTIIGFFLFCLLSSSIYIINDIADIESDRNHPTKRNRPIAAGQLPVPVAVIAACLLLLIIFPLAFWLSPPFFVICLGYLLLNLAYSKWLKHIPLIDILVISAGFVLRVAAGVSLIPVERFPPWIYVAMSLLALFIGLGKRRTELATLAESANSYRKVFEGYSLGFLDELITIVSATTIIVYSLYTFSAPNVPTNHAMMLTIPFVLYAIFRYLYLIRIKHEGGAPEDLLLSDHPLQIAIILWGLSILIVFYIFKS